jgi:hypothetical protein
LSIYISTIIFIPKYSFLFISKARNRDKERDRDIDDRREKMTSQEDNPNMRKEKIIGGPARGQLPPLKKFLGGNKVLLPLALHVSFCAVMVPST